MRENRTYGLMRRGWKNQTFTLHELNHKPPMALLRPIGWHTLFTNTGILDFLSNYNWKPRKVLFVIKIINNLLSIFSDKAFSLYTYLMTFVLTIWFIITIFTRDIEQIIATLLVFVLFAGILFYLDLRFKDRKRYPYIFLEFTVYPAFVAIFLIVLLVINANLLLMPKALLNTIAITTLLLSVTVISYFSVRARLKDESYLKMIRVILDFAEVGYWIIFSVVLFLFVSESAANNKDSTLLDPEISKILKLFILPFMIQTRFIKAYIGYHLQKIEFRRNRLARSGLQR